MTKTSIANRTASRRTVIRSRPPNVRDGFTLIELMVALVLLTTLLLVVWSLLGSLAQLDEKGSQQIGRVQLLRALQSSLQQDIAHRYRPIDEQGNSQPPGGSVPQRGSLEFRGALGSSSILNSDPPAEGSMFSALQSAGISSSANRSFFRGSATSFSIQVEVHPTLSELIRRGSEGARFGGELAERELTSSDLYGGVSNSSDLASFEDEMTVGDVVLGDVVPNGKSSRDVRPRQTTVTYRFSLTTDGKTGGLVRSTSDEAESNSSVGRSSLTSSLEEEIEASERVLDSSDLYRTDETDTSNEALSESTSLTTANFPEIGELQFRYHTGSAWTSTWNSASQQGYPKAIEVQFSLLSGKELREIEVASLEQLDDDESQLDSLYEKPLGSEFGELSLDANDLYGGQMSDDGIVLPYRLIIPLKTLLSDQSTGLSGGSSANGQGFSGSQSRGRGARP